MNILEQICHAKLAHIKQQKLKISEQSLLDSLAYTLPIRPFAHSIKDWVQKKQTAIIAEIKKASPSKGLIRADFNPETLAAAYERGGATCLSVLTDEPYFQGHDSYLKMAKAVTSIPVLRKDFILDTYQVLESRALGADCILLIMAAMTDEQAKDCYQAAKELGLSVLVEVHDQEECNRALQLSPELLGINNRSLKTFEVDLKITLDISRNISKDIVVVCESGIYSHADIAMIQAEGVYSFLVGESLMRQGDVTAALEKLING